MRNILPILVIAISSSHLLGDDETLEFYLSKSDHVLVVESLDDLEKKSVILSEAAHVSNVGCTFKLVQSIKGWGTGREGQTFEETISYPTNDGDRTPKIKAGQKYILFLNTQGVADLWFGIQRYSPAMAKDLARIVKESERKQSGR